MCRSILGFCGNKQNVELNTNEIRKVEIITQWEASHYVGNGDVMGHGVTFFFPPRISSLIQGIA
jgi:hypothetical protein